MPTPTWTVTDPSTDQPFMGLRNVGRDNAHLQKFVPAERVPADRQDWRDLKPGQFSRYHIAGDASGQVYYITRGEDQP